MGVKGKHAILNYIFVAFSYAYSFFIFTYMGYINKYGHFHIVLMCMVSTL